MTKPTLTQLGIPASPFSGNGVHTTPASEGDAIQDPVLAGQFVQRLWDHGIYAVKTFGSTTKQEIAHQVVLRGGFPLHRWWRGHRIGAANYCTPREEIVQYVNVGCKVQELLNEPNLADEYDEGPWGGLPPLNQIANVIWTSWLQFADACNAVGAYACFPAMSPGGDVEHRTLINMLLEYGAQHNYLGRITDNVIALHPRGLNIEIDCPHSDVMTCTFDEYRHSIETYKTAGVDTWYFATEHGWSWGNQGDWARPPVTEQFWYDNNREAFLRMNPAHAKPILPEMLALFYWVQGDPTDWPADSIDQARFGIPAPSRLWVDMEQHRPLYVFDHPPRDSQPPLPVGELKIYKGDGTPGDWAWLRAKYGMNVQIDTSVADTYWKVTEIRENLGGASSVTVKAPQGTPVMFWYTTAPQLPTNVNREWAMIGDHGLVEPKGEISFGMYGGAAYNPAAAPFKGPHNLWCGTSVEHSEQFVGEGWLMGTEHHHLDLTFTYAQAEPPTEDFHKPFDGDYPITCDFACHKARVPPSTAPGVDYATPLGTPALAVADALVMDRGQNAVAGRWVELICHVGSGWYRVFYRHLQDYVVRAGFEVLQGQVIGHTGNTGQSTGPHLHVDVRRFNEFVDPEGLW